MEVWNKDKMAEQIYFSQERNFLSDNVYTDTCKAPDLRT